MTQTGRRTNSWRRPMLERLEERAQPSFLATASYPTGLDPTAVAVADLNNDGVPDLVTANSQGASVSVLLGHGDGSFAPAVSYRAGSTPSAVAIADFNGDGVTDFAVTNYQAGTVSILWGNGDGTFQAPHAINVGPGPTSIAVGDFNGDGAPDLVVTDSSSGTVSVLLNNGDGSFQFALNYPAGPIPQTVEVADLNGDGCADLVIANEVASGTVRVMLGNGDGTFRTAGSYAAGINTASLVVGDFNGDGKLDVAAVDNGQNGAYDSTVYLLSGNGDGTLQSAVQIDHGYGPAPVAAADFNGDGNLDLAVAYNRESNNINGRSVRILLGNGDGSFQSGTGYLTSSDSAFITTDDVNGDGVPDVITADSLSNLVTVLLGEANGTFVTAPSYAVAQNPIGVYVGDFNGDGIPDVLTANASSESVLLGNGDGSFQPARNSPGGGAPFAVADFNGDGILDVALPSGQILLGNGDGTFQSPVNAFGFGTAVTTADLNGDGVPDIISVYFNDISVYRGNGDGTFQSAVSYSVPSAIFVSVTAADVNGDGSPDLVAADCRLNGALVVLLNHGDGTLQPPVPYYAGPYPRPLAVADFNGDGNLDLATGEVAGFGQTTGPVAVLVGNGDGTFKGANYYDGGPGLTSLATADVNGDGIPDLLTAVGYPDAGSVNVLLGKGDASFSLAQSLITGPGTPTAIAVGDFGGTGLPDIVATNYSYPMNSVSVMLNSTTWPASHGNDPFSTPEFAPAAIGDPSTNRLEAVDPSRGVMSASSYSRTDGRKPTTHSASLDQLAASQAREPARPLLVRTHSRLPDAFENGMSSGMSTDDKEDEGSPL